MNEGGNHPGQASQTSLESFDLTKESSDIRKHLVAVIDVDGTLVKGFTKHDFVEFLHSKNVGHATYRQALLDHYRGENQGEYVKFLEDSGHLYAKMLQGVRVDTVKNLVGDWNRTTSRQMFEYTRPLMDYLNKVGITPVLVTGAPQVTLQPFLEDLKLQEVGHGLTLYEEGGEFTGQLERNVGLPHEKARVAQQIADNGHSVIFALGDRPGDGPLFGAALHAHNRFSDVYGSAMLINANREDQNQASSWMANEKRNGRLKILDLGYSEFAVVSEVRELLRRAVGDGRNKDLLNELAGRMSEIEKTTSES